MSENSISFEDLLCGLSENFGAIYLVDFDNDEVNKVEHNEEVNKVEHNDEVNKVENDLGE